jgi:hypothetical protein
VVECDPLAAGLDGQCRKPCVGHQVATGIRFDAKAIENLPVPLARLNNHAMGLIKQDVAESKHLIQTARHCKNLGVGSYADHTAQNLWRHTVTGIAINDTIEPSAVCQMFWGIGAKRVHKDVDIGKDHGAFIASSNSLERLRSIPGRTPPVALDTGNSIRFRRLVFGFDRMSAKASSTSEVRVRPSSAACFFARFNKSSFILIVVLMHQYITSMHQYVKPGKI